MADIDTWLCQTCGNVGLSDGFDGFFYCNRCGSQAEDVIDTGVADEDFVARGGDGGGAAIYLASLRRQRPVSVIKAEPISQVESLYNTQSQFWKSLASEDEAFETLRKDKHLHHGEDFVKLEDNHDRYDLLSPSDPQDFGDPTCGKVLTVEDYYNEVRIRYVMGMQLMIEFQCEALVKELKVSPIICGLVGSIWLRFVSQTGVFDDDWADRTIQDSEMQQEDEPADFKPRSKYSAEPHNMYGQRAVTIWYRSLAKRIPLFSSLAVSFLVCHVAREPVLPTDIITWANEGKLPYFSVFLEIEKQIGRPSMACPISSKFMFRPSQTVSSQKLESLAAKISHFIGLELPPVNFYAIAFRFLKELSLPIERILPCACKIYEWSMPPGLWLSTNDSRLPTRVFVMSILIVAIRILYNINGLGEWEKSLSSNSSKCNTNSAEVVDVGGTSAVSHSENGSDKDIGVLHKTELDTGKILRKLETIYKEMTVTHDYSKDLPTYLQYCKDVPFAGLEPSFEDHYEEKLIEHLWNFFQTSKDSEQAELEGHSLRAAKQQKSSSADGYSRRTMKEMHRTKGSLGESSSDTGNYSLDYTQEIPENEHFSNRIQEDSKSKVNDSAETIEKKEAIRQMKLDMEENRFCYISPRTKLKRLDYLHYVRKRDKGTLTNVMHADYYILLRACAKIAQVDLRIMHTGVLSLERRLAWLEKRIDHCLSLKPMSTSCEFCSDVVNDDQQEPYI